MHDRRLAPSSQAQTVRATRSAGLRACSAGVAQLVEHLFCKQVVGGSSPPASSKFSAVVSEGCPSGQREQAVNLPAHAYVGSNPSPSTSSGPARARNWSPQSDVLSPGASSSASRRASFKSGVLGGVPRNSSCGSSSIGRASAFQAERRGFESLLPLRLDTTSSSLLAGSDLDRRELPLAKKETGEAGAPLFRSKSGPQDSSAVRKRLAKRGPHRAASRLPSKFYGGAEHLASFSRAQDRSSSPPRFDEPQRAWPT